MPEPTEAPEKHCKYCGETFSPSRAWQLFCKALCRELWYKAFNEECRLAAKAKMEQSGG